ncbi:MAG: ABC transporter substrate-binding protein [Burkholderiaceae bacterium]
MNRKTWLAAIATTLLMTGGAARAADPIRIGWLGSLSGALSAAAIVINQGIEYGVAETNRAGGIDGRKLELLTRDTAGDPTKAVNLAQQLIFRDKVHLIIGPVNSGEALAAGPVIAGTGTPELIFSSIESLTSAEKYPSIFRFFPLNAQFIEGANDYVLNTLKLRKIAVLTDSTGYGSTTGKQAEELLGKVGVKPVLVSLIDPNKTDLSDDIAKAKAAGAEVLMPWSNATGMLARIMNASRDIGWNVPIVGHPALSAFAIKSLLHKPEYWENVYAISFASSALQPDGQPRPATRKLMDEARKTLGKKEFDFTFWWFALGYDLQKVAEHAIRTAGSTRPEAIRAALEKTHDYPGAFATLSWSPKNRDGFPLSELAVVKANTFHDGLFTAAPR